MIEQLITTGRKKSVTMVNKTRTPTLFKKWQACLLAIATFTGAAHAAAAEEERVPEALTPSSSLTTTVAQLGYPSGFSFDDTSQPDARELQFPLPQDSQLTSATLRLIYRGSPQLDARATLSVAINDVPLQEVALVQDSTARELQLPIPAELLGGGLLKVTLRGNVPTVYERCIDEQPQSGVLHIYPETSLLTRQTGAARTLRDAWLTLPETVTISLPAGALDEHAFRAALQWVVLLQRHHHQVRFTHLPELGELVIAPASDIRAALTLGAEEPSNEATLWSESGTNLGVIGFRGGQFIAATAPYADVARFAAQWQTLTAPTHVETTPPRRNEAQQRVALNTLGFTSAEALLGHKLQWRATVTPWNLPAGMRAQSAHIKVVLPRSDKQHFRLYAYLNDMLITSERLSGAGGEHSLVIPFDEVRRSEVYQLRLVVRDGGEGDCREPTQRHPVHISPDSHLTLQPETLPPSGFAALPTFFGTGFDLYLPRAYLAEAREQLPMLGRLIGGFAVPSSDYQLVFFDSHEPPVPQRGFIVAAEQPSGGTTPAVRFDQGRMALIDQQGTVLVDERALRQNSVLQMVRSDETTGLWLHPGELRDLPVIDANRLGDNDLAIFEDDHLLLAIDSRQEDLVRPHYNEVPRWFERLSAQRYLWLLACWVLLTLGIIYLYVKSRQHRNT